MPNDTTTTPSTPPLPTATPALRQTRSEALKLAIRTKVRAGANAGIQNQA